MANTPTREHREAALDLAEYLCAAFNERPWSEVRKRILEYLADAEQRAISEAARWLCDNGHESAAAVTSAGQLRSGVPRLRRRRLLQGPTSR